MRIPTLIAIPSLDLGAAYLARTDLAAMEARWLFTLLVAPRVACVTSGPVPDALVAHLSAFARPEALVVSLDDPSPRPLAAKLLERPDVLDELRAFAGDGALIAPFAVGPDDVAVAERLGARIAGIGPEHAHHGTKSGSRRLLARAGVPVPAGTEDVTDAGGVARAAAAIGGPALVKLDVGVTGDGNVRVGDPLPPGLDRGAVVEALVDAVRSPSVQAVVTPQGDVEVLATHDQVLDGFRYTGCRIPAAGPEAADLEHDAREVGALLAAEGAVGRFGIDYVVDAAGARYAVEINLREGATTHPVAIQRALGADHAYATDAFALAHPDPIGAAADAGLAWNGTEGIVFTLLRPDRVGIVALAPTPERCAALADDLRALDQTTV